MVKGKKTVPLAPPVAASAPAKSAGVKRKSRKQSNRIYIGRVCKELDIHTPNRDGFELLNGAYGALLRGFLAHVKHMSGGKKTIARKTIRLAFIGYMDSLGASDEIVQEALERADAALVALFPALE